MSLQGWSHSANVLEGQGHLADGLEGGSRLVDELEGWGHWVAECGAQSQQVDEQQIEMYVQYL